MIISKRSKLAFFLASVVLLLVAAVNMPRFLEENTGGSLRKSVLRIAEVVIPLKDRILGRTIADKLARLQSTGACQFCDLSEASMSGIDLSYMDLRNANLSGADLSGANLSGANLRNANLTEVNLTDVNLNGTRLDRATLINANLRRANLSRAGFEEVNLQGGDLAGARFFSTDLTNAKIIRNDLKQGVLCYTKLPDGKVTGCDLSGQDLSGLDLTDTNLTGMNLTDMNLTGTTLVQTNLSGTNLSGVDLSDKDLTGANLIGANLTGANLTKANLTGSYLYDTKLVDADLGEANLVGARLSGADLTGANLLDSDLGGIDLKEINRNQGEALIEIKESENYREVTSFDLTGDEHFLTTKPGILYEFKNGKSKIVLDLNNDPKFTDHGESGLLSVVSNNKFVYISYGTNVPDGDKHRYYLVVDEYSKTFDKVKNIVQIELTTEILHRAGTLVFDNLGKLYLSVGDGGPENDPENHAQNLHSLLGKILRLDVSKTNREPEIVAYGLRNPWKISIDSKNRMFVADCGAGRIESVYLLDDLYPTTPYNLGWPVFEGTERRKEDPLTFEDTLAPIYEYRHYLGVGGCVIGGFFLDEPEVYLFGDFYGILRLLKQQKDGTWYEIHSQHVAPNIWSFGYNEETKKLFVSETSKIFEFTISTEQINLLPWVRICRTTMPNGTINNSGC